MKAMLKTGDSISKHGGAQATTVRTPQLPSVAATKCTPSLQIVGSLPNVDNTRTTSVVLQCHGGDSEGYTFANNGGVVHVGLSRGTPPSTTDLHRESNTTSYIHSDSRIKVEHHVDEAETEAVRNQALEWLQVNGQETEELGLLPKVLSSSLRSMETTSEFSERVNDFAFVSSIPENSEMKNNMGIRYFETLETGDYATAVRTPHISWSSGEQNTPLSCSSSGAFVSFPDALAEDVISAGAISCSTSDLNSMLFDGISHDLKSDTLPVEIMQYADGLSFAVGGKNVMCSDDSVNNFNINTISSSPSSNMKSIPLTFGGTMVDQVALRNLHDSSGDLNLTSLPNFLGLENTPADVSANGHFIDGGSVNILEENTLSLDSQTVASSTNLPEHILHSIDTAQLKNQKISVTTISISNDEENSTKILVESHQGQQQMYVLNTANMNKSHSGNVHQGNMFVINASDLNQASNGTFSISTLSSNIDSMAMTSQPITSQPSLTASAIPGFVLVPVVDSAANMVQAVPIQISDGDPNTKKPRKMFMCVAPGCRKTFKKASKLKVHQMLHTGERPFKCSLLGCEWAFTTSNKLKRHLESHEGRKDYMCDSPGCGHRFTTVYNLNNHRKLHDRPCTETCTEDGCNQKFATKRQLDLHLRNVHSCEDRTFKCPEPGCEKTFFSSGCMGSHMKVHLQNQEELRCKVPGCGKEFTKMCRLRQHERLHSGEKPFICDFQGCTWAFATASKLKRHQTKHTGLRKWICEVCKKQFHRSEHLKGHLITHSGDRPFICPVEGCGNTFTAKSSLYVHLKKHDESGKTIVYHCPMEKCEKHYANKASLRQHILVKHCNLPHKDSADGSHGVVSWLSLLSSGDANADISLEQESYTEELGQASLAPGQDPMMPTDFLTGGMTDQALLNSSSETLPDHQNCSGLMSQLMMSAGPGSALTSPEVVPSLAVTAGEVSIHPQQLQQPQQQHMFIDDSMDQRLLEAGEILQQQERLSFEAVERGKKSQIMLENTLGSARTDPRSNDIISLRALKRWQKQKEIEAAKLRVRLNAPTATSTPCQLVMDAEGDYKNIVSNNVSLAGHHLIQTVMIPGQSDGEIPIMELQAEGISDSSSSSGGDSFMTELFIRDPETGITYRQTQLLQDDPPNPEMMEDMEGVSACHGMTLDTSLDTQFVGDSLNFHSLE